MKKVRRTVKIVISYFLFYSGFLTFVRYFRRNNEKEFRILMYHHITEKGEGLPPAIFKRQMVWVSRHYSVVSLSELLLRQKEGRPFPQRGLAITFDDGYRDFLTEAYPILKKKGIPVTLFPVVDCLDQKPLWTELLKHHKELKEKLKRVADEDRRLLLKQVQKELVGKGEEDGTPGLLTWEEILELSKNGVEIGAHTLSHPILTQVSSSEAKRQVVESKQRLEERLLKEVDLFCYPNGQPGDFNAEIVKIIRDSGFLGACTTIEGKNDLTTNDPYALRRMPTWEKSLPIFACELEGCFNFFSHLLRIAQKKGWLSFLKEILERFWCTRRLLILERPIPSPRSFPKPIGNFTFGWLREEEKRGLTVLKEDLTLEKIEERLFRGDRCFVARKDGEIVAFTWVTRKPRYGWAVQSEIPIEENQIYRYNSRVAPYYRRQGIFLNMVHHLEKVLMEEGMRSFRIAIFPDNDAAIRANKKDGFVETGYILYQRRLFWTKRKQLFFNRTIPSRANRFTRLFHFIRREGILAFFREFRKRIWSTRILLLFERPVGKSQSLWRAIGSFDFGWLREDEKEKLYLLQKDLTVKKVEERLSRGDRCFVARKEGKVMSFAWLTTKAWGLWDVRSLIIPRKGSVCFYNARTDVRYRGLGLLSMLAHHLDKVLAEEGVERFLVVVEPKNRVAIRCFKRDGFVCTGHVFYRRRLFLEKREKTSFAPTTPISSFYVGGLRKISFMTPAIVIGQGRTGLGVDRLLGRRGISIIKVAGDPSSLGTFSRYGDFVKMRIGDTEGFVSLLKTIKKCHRTEPVLIPTSDEAVLWLSEMREFFQQHTRYSLPEKKVIRTFLDKALFAEEAMRLGFSVPKTRRVEDGKDIESIAQEKLFPCVLKPCNGRFPSHEGAKALWVSGKEELYRVSRQFLRENIPFLIQEAIPGEDSQHWSCAVYLDSRGKPLGLFTAQKIRQYPPSVGIASVCESRWNERVAKEAVSLLQQMKYTGIAEVEFKEDRRDGVLKIIEVNPRLWIQHPLAARCGIDFAFLVYQGSLGIFPEKLGPQQEGVRWVALDLDLLTAHKLYREGKIELVEWFETYRQPVEPALFQWSDPRPGFYRTGEMVHSFLKRRSS